MYPGCNFFVTLTASNRPFSLFSITGGVTGISFGGGKIIFPVFFFSGVKCFFSPEKIPILVHPKQILVVFKSKKQKKKVLSSFSSFHFQCSNFSVSILILFCYIFPRNFLVRSLCWEHSAPLPPPVMPLFHHTFFQRIQREIKNQRGQFQA